MVRLRKLQYKQAISTLSLLCRSTSDSGADEFFAGIKCSKLKAKYGTFGGFFFFNGRGDLVISQISHNIADSALKYKLFINLNL
jgi:hypothetical protein